MRGAILPLRNTPSRRGA